MKKKKEQNKRMTAEEFDKEPVFKKKLAETKEIFKEHGLKECFGYYATRNIKANTCHAKVIENVSDLSKCFECEPHIRDICFQSSLLRQIAIIFKD